MQYAKLTDGKIEFAPKNKGRISNYNLSPELMTKDGYKPLVVIEQPTEDKPIVKYRETDEQIEQYAEELPIEQKQASVRSIRNQYLADTDKYMIVDYPITDEQREEYKEYRTYLRTYPECQEWYESNPLTFDEWVQKKELATESKLNYLDTAQEMNDGTIQSGEGDISVSDEVVSDNTDTE